MPSLPESRRLIACGHHPPHYAPKPADAIYIDGFARLLGVTQSTFSRMRGDRRLSERARPPLPDDYELCPGGARPWWSKTRAREFVKNRGGAGVGGGAGKHRGRLE